MSGRLLYYMRRQAEFQSLVGKPHNSGTLIQSNVPTVGSKKHQGDYRAIFDT